MEARECRGRLKNYVYDECDDYWLFVIFFIVIVYDECDVVHDGDYDDSLQGKTRNYCDHNNVGFKLKKTFNVNDYDEYDDYDDDDNVHLRVHMSMSIGDSQRPI